MNLKTQKKLAGEVLKCSPNRVRFDTNELDAVKGAITRADMRRLVISGIVSAVPVRGVCRSGARKIMAQKSKDRQKGAGSRKGKKTARLSKKEIWMNKVRKQRELFKSLRSKGMITVPTYREMYLKVKGGFFRSIRHIKLYLSEHNLIVQNKKE